MITNVEDKNLIVQYLKGDDHALEILIGKYLKPIYNFVYKNVGSEADAEDISQEVFVKVWKNIKKFDQKKNFKPWIYQIAKNTAIDFLRKKKTIPFSKFENEKGQNAFLENIIAAPVNLIEIFHNKKALSLVMAHLNEKEQKIITLRHGDGMSFREISEIFNESINTIKSRYRRIVKNLRQKDLWQQ